MLCLYASATRTTPFLVPRHTLSSTIYQTLRTEYYLITYTALSTWHQDKAIPDLWCRSKRARERERDKEGELEASREALIERPNMAKSLVYAMADHNPKISCWIQVWFCSCVRITAKTNRITASIVVPQLLTFFGHFWASLQAVKQASNNFQLRVIHPSTCHLWSLNMSKYNCYFCCWFCVSC